MQKRRKNLSWLTFNKNSWANFCFGIIDEELMETHTCSFCLFVLDHWLEIENFCCKCPDLEIKGV